MNKLTLLGTGTNTIQKSRMASSVLIENGKSKIIFDMGRGITQRLLDLKIQQDEIEHIIISHFHPDHISDLIPYIHAALWSTLDKRTKDLVIHGPKGIKELIHNVIIEKLVPSYKMKDDFKIITKEISEKGFNINNQTFKVSVLQPANNHAIKFQLNKKKIGLTGDFHFSQEVIDFLKGLDLAVIDAGHSSKQDIVKLAVKSQVKKIIMSHLYKEYDTDDMNQIAKKAGYKGKFIKGEDLMSFDF